MLNFFSFFVLLRAWKWNHFLIQFFLTIFLFYGIVYCFSKNDCQESLGLSAVLWPNRLIEALTANRLGGYTDSGILTKLKHWTSWEHVFFLSYVTQLKYIKLFFVFVLLIVLPLYWKKQCFKNSHVWIYACQKMNFVCGVQTNRSFSFFISAGIFYRSLYTNCSVLPLIALKLLW